MEYTHSFRIRYAETDQMGVVYHGNYAQFFELGRTEWLRQIGLTYKEMEQEGILLPVVSLKCDFLKSAYYDEALTVKTMLVELPTAKIQFNYEIRNANNELLTTGNTILVFVSSETKRAIRCPEHIIKKIKEFNT